MALKVVCLTNQRLRTYRRIAESMKEGIDRCGDKAVLADIRGQIPDGDAAVMWGWKRRLLHAKFRQFVYADLGYWGRGQYYRLIVNGWSPASYVRSGLPASRFQHLGLQMKPWKGEGREIIIAGSTAKAATCFGVEYMAWETMAAKALKDCGHPVVYRPKPTDPAKRAIRGIGYDTRPLDVALASARAVVTHHSNVAIDALLNGLPVHCEMGAAAALSVPLVAVADAQEPEGRERFLYDVAWLQWTLAEMKSGAAWAHLKEQGLIC